VVSSERVPSVTVTDTGQRFGGTDLAQF
jgi:hypothetical protein